MRPKHALPLPKGYVDEDQYVEDLLAFVTSNDLFQLLVGGVHILDFFTSDPPLYPSLLDEAWRVWFGDLNISDVLDFVLREDLSHLKEASESRWRFKSSSPPSLVEYLTKIRSLTLLRQRIVDLSIDAPEDDGSPTRTIPRHLAVGMQEKKLHEVESFARYVQKLSDYVSSSDRPVTHLVDFGSGQNYLGRTLANHPYNKHVIAVESRHENVEGAKAMDVRAKLAKRDAPKRNKKEFRREVELRAREERRDVKEVLNEALKADRIRQREETKRLQEERSVANGTAQTDNNVARIVEHSTGCVVRAKLDGTSDGKGSVQYVERRLEDGDLGSVVDEILDETAIPPGHVGGATENLNGQVQDLSQHGPRLMVMSIHSCGNLSHHGLRSLTLNPSVRAVALIGCCYNLVTESLTSPTHKLSSLRPAKTTAPPTIAEPQANGDKAARCAGADYHGFPMSQRLYNYPTTGGLGVHLNITARMMALQAPLNWGAEDSAGFFTRHFYRALLQRIFLDRGVVTRPSEDQASEGANQEDQRGSTASGRTTASTQAIIIGSLRKAAYGSFTSYVRAAITKLSSPSNHHPALACTDLPNIVSAKMSDITDEEIAAYERQYEPQKKDLSIIWTLMAYSAQLVEAVMVVDRWLWLREQEEVEDCWVENVFDYAKSPRNLVVVGIKKRQAEP